MFSLIFYLYFLPILDDEGPVAAIITVSVLSVVNQVPERKYSSHRIFKSFSDKACNTKLHIIIK